MPLCWVSLEFHLPEEIYFFLGTCLDVAHTEPPPPLNKLSTTAILRWRLVPQGGREGVSVLETSSRRLKFTLAGSFVPF